MRRQINKLTKGHSTKAERKFCEFLKKYRIPFLAKVKLQNHEIDFIIGKYAIEIDGHKHSIKKNQLIWNSGYFPIHLYNYEIGNHLIPWLKTICH